MKINFDKTPKLKTPGAISYHIVKGKYNYYKPVALMELLLIGFLIYKLGWLHF